jgi:DNA-binding protein HU-beta
MANNNNLTKSEIVDALQAKLETDSRKVPKALCNQIVKSIFDGESGLISNWLSTRNHRVTIPGFGTFGTTYRKARKGQHPKTQEPIQIPATYAVSFRPGKNLKESISGK